MDANAVVARLRQTREQLRAALLAGRPGYGLPDVFPRSATMRFLLDPRRRGIATTVLGALASFAWGRHRRKRRRKAAARQRVGTLARVLLGLFSGRGR